MTAASFSRTWDSILPALGNHLWQSTVFVVAVWLLTLFLRKNHARTRYWLWLAASLKFLIPFSLLIALGSQMAAPRHLPERQRAFYWAMEQVSRPFTQPAIPLVPKQTHASVSPSNPDILVMASAAVWLCGFVAALLVWFVRWRRISSMVLESEPVCEGREVEALHHLQSRTAIRQKIEIRLSQVSMEPGICGIFHPILLWPAGISRHLGDEHLEAILAHELGHVRRRDNLAAAIHMMMESIFWFHPLVWWLGARLVEERERACDEEVLRLGSERQVYAESILKTCEFCVESPLACVSGVTGADLKRRVTRIMTHSLAERLSLGRKALLAVIGAATIAGPIFFGLLHTTQISAQPQKTTNALSLAYEVASIEPNRAGDGLVRMKYNGDGLKAEGVTAKILVQLAYHVKDFQISGEPGWADSDRYDIEAKVDQATLAALNKLSPEEGKEQRQRMLQALLAERFKLKLSQSTKDLPIYALVLATNGPRFSESPTPPPDPPRVVTRARFSATGGDFTATTMTMTGLADWLSQRLGRSVVDNTGLNGKYDLTLHWDPGSDLTDPGSSDLGPAGPSIFTALQEQLGLKLESQKGPVDILTIDSVERPGKN